jgi:hypothetical protein
MDATSTPQAGADRDADPQRPLLLVVDEDEDALARTERELTRRYGGDYDVRAERSAAGAVPHAVALLSAGPEPAEQTGSPH